MIPPTFEEFIDGLKRARERRRASRAAVRDAAREKEVILPEVDETEIPAEVEEEIEEEL